MQVFSDYEFLNKGEIYTFTAFGNIVEESTNRPTTETQISDKLKQMGDTEYFIDKRHSRGST